MATVQLSISELEDAIRHAKILQRHLEREFSQLQATSMSPIRQAMTTLLTTMTSWHLRAGTPDGVTIDQGDFDSKPWTKLVEHGAFAAIYRAEYMGSKVAVKLLNDDVKMSQSIAEGRLLRTLTHDNIVEFRGIGKTATEYTDSEGHIIPVGRQYLVMEYISGNLQRYVELRKTPENEGLPEAEVWDFSRQILLGLLYLHKRKPHPIAHMDLKPDNVLLDEGQVHPRVKLADFGLALPLTQGTITAYRGHARWMAPELWPGHIRTDQMSNDHLLKSDIYSYGLVMLFLITGKTPWDTSSQESICPFDESMESDSSWPSEPPGDMRYTMPPVLASDLQDIISVCYMEDPLERATSEIVHDQFFRDRSNPFRVSDMSSEFFSCGFLDDTQIFVADSLVTEGTVQSGPSGKCSKGYCHSSLVYTVQVNKTRQGKVIPAIIKPENWDYDSKFQTHFNEFLQLANSGRMKHNSQVALKDLRLRRLGVDEEQEIVMEFAETSYIVHKAMRKVWMEDLTPDQREAAVPDKGTVNRTYSNSFGLHVAVITNDTPTPKCVFTRRAVREGLSSPGKITCGAVRGCSAKDYIPMDDGSTGISLVKAAVRGLNDELGIVLLHSCELDVITLTTVYLKFDTHEWGLCGFVDLRDERIHPDRRLTAADIRSCFTSAGMKDRYEHERVIAVDFTLPAMAQWVREHFRDFASSAKLCVVKVMQSFFGIKAVEKALHSAEEG